MNLNLESTGRKGTAWSILWNSLTLFKVTIMQTTTKDIYIQEHEFWSLRQLIRRKKWHFKDSFWTTLEDLKKLGEELKNVRQEEG
jgi:hypothetical protein